MIMCEYVLHYMSWPPTKFAERGKKHTRARIPGTWAWFFSSPTSSLWPGQAQFACTWAMYAAVVVVMCRTIVGERGVRVRR